MPPLPPAESVNVKLRSPTDLVAITPYLLGFHPDKSVVLAAFRGNRAIFAARSDLPGPETPPADLLADHLLQVTVAQGPDLLAILGYGAAGEVDGLLRSVWAAAEQRELPIGEVLRVDAGRWWSYLCQEPDCCPPEGTRFDPAATEAAATCAFAGLAVAPDRAALAATVAPPAGAARVAIERATDRAERSIMRCLATIPEPEWAATIEDRGDRAIRAAIDRYADSARLDDDELAELSVLLVSLPVRDVAWRAITTPQPHLRLWTDATQRVVPELAAAPASLLGFAAWRAGDGALARLALARALTADPEYSMAQMLLDAVQRGVPPAVLDDWPVDQSTRSPRV
ncbi:DUF4192 domain-containing protein [Natronosporangium hydrolyticum]|uniref:DUF4192 domain-containing protein n=2 Tax=Natronosporangium hydrolyticum TaxID=2811111 RepID=A0A895YHJ7_9ACTN|nr:DUF4192 domain-containing protein [Natronosporangium hydrolyticum]